MSVVRDYMFQYQYSVYYLILFINFYFLQSLVVDVEKDNLLDELSLLEQVLAQTTDRSRYSTYC